MKEKWRTTIPTSISCQKQIKGRWNCLREIDKKPIAGKNMEAHCVSLETRCIDVYQVSLKYIYTQGIIYFRYIQYKSLRHV